MSLKLFGALAASTASCLSINQGTPDLAQAIQASDTVVVARVVGGTARSDRTGTSADLLLHVIRVLKGAPGPGSQIPVKTSGDSRFTPDRAPRAPRTWAVEHFTALWFLHSDAGQYAAVPVTPGAGEPERTSLLLPEDSPGAPASGDLHRAVGEEIVVALRKEKPINRDQLAQTLATLGDAPALLAIYRELAAERAGFLRATGIAGLIAAGDPAGPKQAAAELRVLYPDGSTGPIAASLAGYLNPDDADAVLAVGRLATDNPDLEIPMLRLSAARALNALHTRDTMPALIALLDSRDPAVGGQALNGICLFVRNAPFVTAQSIPSGSWRQSREPAPFRTAQTDSYCWMNPLPANWAPPEYIVFWKSWWHAHAAEVMRVKNN